MPGALDNCRYEVLGVWNREVRVGQDPRGAAWPGPRTVNWAEPWKGIQF